MSKVYTDTVTSTEASQDLTLGGSGDNVIVTAGATLKTNTVKDSGGNTLWTSDGSGNLSSVNAVMKGNMTLLSTQTASNAASVSFTSGIDNTYRLYIFKFIDIHSDNDAVNFSFQANATDTADYNDIAMTTTHFATLHLESDGGTPEVSYRTASDQAQGTAFQKLTGPGMQNDADASLGGTLWLFNPSNTTYVKHFYSRMQYMENSARSWETYVGGYFNTTTAIDDLRFKMSAGTFDGTIKMYGLG